MMSKKNSSVTDDLAKALEFEAIQSTWSDRLMALFQRLRGHGIELEVNDNREFELTWFDDRNDQVKMQLPYAPTAFSDADRLEDMESIVNRIEERERERREGEARLKELLKDVSEEDKALLREAFFK